MSPNLDKVTLKKTLNNNYTFFSLPGHVLKPISTHCNWLFGAAG